MPRPRALLAVPGLLMLPLAGAAAIQASAATTSTMVAAAPHILWTTAGAPAAARAAAGQRSYSDSRFSAFPGGSRHPARGFCRDLPTGTGQL